MEEPSASEVHVDVPNSLTDVLPETPDPLAELAQPSEEPSASDERPVVEENLPQMSDSSTITKPLTAVKVYPSRMRKTVDRFEPTWN